jgi:hypothetical protein
LEILLVIHRPSLNQIVIDVLVFYLLDRGVEVGWHGGVRLAKELIQLGFQDQLPHLLAFGEQFLGRNAHVQLRLRLAAHGSTHLIII